MGKILEHKISQFDGGITNDPRDTAPNVAKMVTNFDIITNPKKLIPYRDSISGDASANARKQMNFLLGLGNGTQYVLYGLGISGSTIQLLSKNTFTDGTWNPPAANTGTGSVNNNLFVYYKRKALIYGASGTNRIWAFSPSGGPFDPNIINTDGGTPFSFTNIAQGLVHSKDDILYIPYNNNIAKNNNGVWTNVALALPLHYVITSICEYGNQLAIGAVNLSGEGSRVYLWDRDSTLTTISESIDWGSGQLKILEEIDGKLIGISLDSYAIDGFGGTGAVTRLRDVVRFRYLSGGTAVKFKELIGTTNTLLLTTKQKINNRLHFLMSITTDGDINLNNGTIREGVWSIGRSSEGAPFALIHERTPYNDTALSAGALKSFFYVGDFLFIASTNNAGTWQISMVNPSLSWTATSIYETVKFSLGDILLTKKLLKATVTTEYLQSGQQVVLKYKKDNDTSWTTIFTNTTLNSLRHSAINIESSGAALPQFKEIQFRIESTGGAEITGLIFKAEVINDDIAE